jgi:hypothetical protein
LRLTKEIYEADFDGNDVKRRLRRTFLDQIELVLERGQVKSKYPKSARTCDKFDEIRRREKCARIVASGRIISAYPNEKYV